ncbi:MAG: hypothetical protein JNK49_11210 [Planctomycetes bacterium]|nr:hypothetical protein [Planctomycetota bacterium]
MAAPETRAARDPEALRRLSTALGAAVQSLAAAHARWRRRAALAAAIDVAPWVLLWLGPACLLWWLVLPLPVWLPVAVLAGIAAWRAAVMVAGWQLPAPLLAEAALACDAAHQNQDRLTAACEFAAAPAGAAGGLGEALTRLAIEDGLASLARIDAQVLALPGMMPALRWPRAVGVLLLLLLVPLLLPKHHTASAPGTEASAPTAAAAGGRGDAAARREVAAADRPITPPGVPPAEPKVGERAPEAGRPGAPPPNPPRAEAVPAVPAASGRGQAGNDAVGDSAASGAPKAAPVGNPGRGQSGGGQGASAGGAPEPQPAPEQPAVQKPAPKKPPARQTPQQDGKPGESAGAPSGPSRGSGRTSAVANKRSDPNRGQERDDDPPIEDEPVPDETDEQEQRGGVMPMRRGDQRPAARELSISGDGPPDQGRGGPTPPKKSRGTASLVLGVRLPDSVRGQPNPGTAKTTLEQIPPRPGEAAPGLARALPPSRAGTPQSRRHGTPWQGLLPTYHALLRGLEGAPPATAPTVPQPTRTRDPQ